MHFFSNPFSVTKTLQWASNTGTKSRVRSIPWFTSYHNCMIKFVHSHIGFSCNTVISKLMKAKSTKFGIWLHIHPLIRQLLSPLSSLLSKSTYLKKNFYHALNWVRNFRNSPYKYIHTGVPYRYMYIYDFHIDIASKLFAKAGFVLPFTLII